jgi:hypothetical protein
VILFQIEKAKFDSEANKKKEKKRKIIVKRYFIAINLMASVGFAKLLRIRVRIYTVVKAAWQPKIKVLTF